MGQVPLVLKILCPRMKRVWDTKTCELLNVRKK